MASYCYSGRTVGEVVAKAACKGPLHETKFNRCGREGCHANEFSS